jgi:transposase-like protein
MAEGRARFRVEPEGGATRTRWSAAEGARVAAAWRRSGLSQIEFCRREGLDRQRLRRWIARTPTKRASGRSASASRLVFRPVRLVEAPPTAPAPEVAAAEGAWMELVGAGRWRLRVPPGFEPEALRRLLVVLGA